MPKLLSQAEMALRFKEVKQLIAAGEERLKPLVTERDALAAKYDPQLQELGRKIKKLTEELKMYDLKMELSALTRAMKS